jgi:hypothetical protein
MENPDILIAKEQLEQLHIVIAIVKDGEILFTSTKKGIQPFFDVLTDHPRDIFAGCSIADRVVGKAALMLADYLGAKQVFSPLASEHAQTYAKASKGRIELKAERIVDHIINRTHDGMCPMEKAVLDIDDPEEAFEALNNKLQELNS